MRTHINLRGSELTLSVRLQVWSMSDRSTQIRHHKHPAEPWSVPHHGGIWHVLLHQYLQRGELSICQGSEGAIVGWHGRKCQRGASNHLPRTHPPAGPQYHRQHGSVRWAQHKGCATFTRWPSVCSFCVGQTCKPVIKLSSTAVTAVRIMQFSHLKPIWVIKNIQSFPNELSCIWW